MNTVKTRLKNLFDDYEIWETNKSFYNNRSAIDINDFWELPCFHNTDIDGINQCSSDIIVIDNLTEGINTLWRFNQYDNTKHYIIVSGGTWDKQKNDIGINSYDILYFPLWIIELADNYLSPHRFSFYLDKNYDFQYPKPYKFVSTVGNQRPERDLFIKKICDNISYDDFLLKYSGEDLGRPSNKYDIININKGEFDAFELLSDKYYHTVSQTLPIDMYNQCYLNLCVETSTANKDSFFITEKTVKCLISGMPFVAVSTPYFLQGLHRLGFRTYGELWDESYDLEEDYEQRCDKISKLVNNLGTKDWPAIKRELQEIANHNIRNFTKMNTIMDEFFNDLTALANKYNSKQGTKL
jgi:hypothetical protein